MLMHLQKMSKFAQVTNDALLKKRKELINFLAEIDTELEKRKKIAELKKKMEMEHSKMKTKHSKKY